VLELDITRAIEEEKDSLPDEKIEHATSDYKEKKEAKSNEWRCE
jgi:hypothetical protein